MTRVAAARSDVHAVPASQFLGKKIAFYSPDIELCANLRLLFENEYTLYTTTDPEMLAFIANLLIPDLLIADVHLTDKMAERFREIKRKSPKIHIILFNASHLDGEELLRSSHGIVDAVIYKPVDIAELKSRIQEFLPEAKES